MRGARNLARSARRRSRVVTTVKSSDPDPPDPDPRPTAPTTPTPPPPRLPHLRRAAGPPAAPPRRPAPVEHDRRPGEAAPRVAEVERDHVGVLGGLEHPRNRVRREQHLLDHLGWVEPV